MQTTPLPEHLRAYWAIYTTDPRDSPVYCPKQSRKTPAIPWHNGYPKCLSCGKLTETIVHNLLTFTVQHA